MQNTMTIFRREFAAYFNSPIAYIFIIAFLVLNSGLFMTGFFLNGAADLRGVLRQPALLPDLLHPRGQHAAVGRGQAARAPSSC